MYRLALVLCWAPELSFIPLKARTRWGGWECRSPCGVSPGALVSLKRFFLSPLLPCPSHHVLGPCGGVSSQSSGNEGECQGSRGWKEGLWVALPRSLPGNSFISSSLQQHPVVPCLACILSFFPLGVNVGFFGVILFPTRSQPSHHKMPHSREGQDFALRSRFFYEAISSHLQEEGLPTRQVTRGSYALNSMQAVLEPSWTLGSHPVPRTSSQRLRGLPGKSLRKRRR